MPEDSRRQPPARTWRAGCRCLSRRAPLPRLLVAVVVLALACDAKKKQGGAAPASRAAGERCEAAKTAQQLIKRARKLDREAAIGCLEAGSRRFETSGELWEEYGALSDDMGMRHEALEMLERALALKPTLGLAALRLGNIYASLSDDDRAIQFFKKARKARPDSPVPYNNIGLAHMRHGRMQDALDIFRRGMDATAEGAYGRAMILNNLGLLYKQMGQWEEAVESFQRAMASEPSIEAASNLAAILLDAGSYEQAWELCAGLLDQGHMEQAILELAVAALALLGRMHDAAEVAKQGGALEGADAVAPPGGVLQAAIERVSNAGQPLAALDLLATSHLARPRHFVRAGQLLTEANGREEQREALRAYATALRLAYDKRAAGGSGHEDEEAAAEAAAEEAALARQPAGFRPQGPSSLQAMRGLSLLLYQMTRYGDAEGVFRRMLALLARAPPPPDLFSLAETYNGLGASIEMSHTRLDDAVAFYKASVDVKADFQAPFFSMIHLLGRICDWRQWDELFDRARRLIDLGLSGGMGPIFALAYPLSDAQLCSVTRNRAADVEQRVRGLGQHVLDLWYANMWAEVAAQPVLAPVQQVDKLALAVVSADLNARPVGQLVQGIFERLDPGRFEVFCFALEVYDGSEPARRILESVADMQLVKGVDSRLLAEMINSVQAHVMIDLNGYTDGGRSELLPLKPAPVTVAYLGYPYTMALAGVDYMMTDRVVTPPEHYTACFSERLAVLPNTYMVSNHRQSHKASIRGTFSVEEARQRSLPHADNQVVLSNFNHLQKLGPATFDLWTRILRHNPNSSLWLLKFPREAEAHLHRAAAAAGVAPRRILLTDKFPLEEHLRVKRAASLLLDTLEYNAHVSGLDALWAGLPLVTLAGSNMARRCGASFLQSLRLPYLLARTQDEYVRIANILARSGPGGSKHHLGTLKRVRAAVEQQRDSAPLFDTDEWVSDFQRMLLTMWETAHATGSQVGSPQARHLVLAGHRGWHTQS